MILNDSHNVFSTAYTKYHLSLETPLKLFTICLSTILNNESLLLFNFEQCNKNEISMFFK